MSTPHRINLKKSNKFSRSKMLNSFGLTGGTGFGFDRPDFVLNNPL
jgi:hypothetical protein